MVVVDEIPQREIPTPQSESLHRNRNFQGRTQDLSEGVARFFRNKKIDN